MDVLGLLGNAYADPIDPDPGKAEKYLKQAVEMGDSRESVRQLLRSIEEQKTEYRIKSLYGG